MHFPGAHDGRAGDARPGDSRLAVALGIAWLLLVVVWLTLAPFTPRSGAAEVRLSPSAAPHDVVGNLLLFAPLGAVAGALLRGRRRLPAVATLILASACIEIAQLDVAGRVVSPYDVLLNGAGAAIAAWMAGAAVRRGWRSAALTSAVYALVYLGAIVYLLGSAIGVRRGMRLEGWDPAFEVIAGDERGGERAYAGEVSDARVCASPAHCAGPGATSGERRALVDSIARAQRVTLSAGALSRSDAQRGPARIVTFSAGADRRNATLAQEGRDLILRLRTRLAGDNGTGLQLALPASVRAGEPAIVVGSYDRGVLRLEARSGRRTRVATYRPTLLDAWFAFRRPGVIVRRDVLLARLAGILVLALPLLSLLASRARRGASGRVHTAVAGTP